MFLKTQTQTTDLLPKSKEKITFSQLVLAGAFIVLSFSSCTVAVSNKKLASKRITNVQLADGTAILVQPENANYRDPKLITEFTKQWLSLMFSWDGTQPGTEQPDPGVKTTKGKRVPINSWAASLMMSTRFREDFLNELSALVPDAIFSRQSRLKSAVMVRYDSPPRQLNPTTWQIDLIADWILFDEAARTQKKAVPFNKTFTVKAVSIPISPLEQNANTLEKTIFKMRSSGLEIVSIVDYNEQ